VDVTPRPATEVPAARPGRNGGGGRGPLVGLALVALLAAVGFLLVKQVGSASVYFYNADEAVAKRSELGDRRFRIQGTYEGTKSTVAGGAIRFAIVFRGERVVVEHTGSEPALFEPGTAVVCEGRWAPSGRVFESDRIEVKHSAEYKAENPDRVDPAAP